MMISRRALSITIVFSILLLNLQKCDGRFHYHKHGRSHRYHKHSYYYTGTQISVPPAASTGEPPATDDAGGGNYSFELPPAFSPAQPPVGGKGSRNHSSELPPAITPAQPPVDGKGSRNYSSELPPAITPAQPPVDGKGSRNYSSELPPAITPAQPPVDGKGSRNYSSELPPAITPAQPPVDGKGSRNYSSELPPAITPAQPPVDGKGSRNYSSELPPAITPAQPPVDGKGSRNYSSELPPAISPAPPPINGKGSRNYSSELPPAISPAQPPVNGKGGRNYSSELPPAISPARPPVNNNGSENYSSEVPPATFAQPPNTRNASGSNDSLQMPPVLSPAQPPSTRKAGGTSDNSKLPPVTPPAQPPTPSKHSSSTRPPAITPAEPPTTKKSSGKNDSSQLPPATSPAEPPMTNTDGSNNHSSKQPPVMSPAEPPNTSKNGHNNSGAQLPPATSPANPPTPGKHSSSNVSSSGQCVFDVRSFGALGDGSSDDTKAFRAAWKAACAADSGVLLVPSDGVFMITSTIFSGPCKAGLVLQMDGVLMPPDGPNCWPATDSRKQWLVFYKVDSMTLKGEGTIEGNGEEWWSLPCKPHRGPHGSTLPGPCDSPALIRFFLSYNITVRGLRIENSPQFHIKFDGCEGVRIEGLSISSPALSPNTDGIHIENTKSVSIRNSVISNGDDCISIGPGCSNVDIANVSCGPSHGISIGSLGVHNSQACVSNVTVRSSRIRSSDNGVRIKTWQGGTGAVSGISFEDIYMEDVRNCIIIDQYYCMAKPCLNQTSAVRVAGVSYRNIRGTYDVRSPPVHFACSDAVACTNITMAEVELLPHEGVTVDEPFCWNAYGVAETLTVPPVYCLQEGQPLSLQENAGFGCSS